MNNFYFVIGILLGIYFGYSCLSIGTDLETMNMYSSIKITKKNLLILVLFPQSALIQLLLVGAIYVSMFYISPLVERMIDKVNIV